MRKAKRISRRKAQKAQKECKNTSENSFDLLDLSKYTVVQSGFFLFVLFELFCG
jgi:hypothetical protein